jgi:Stage II sporulation protein E (SpoIIE)
MFSFATAYGLGPCIVSGWWCSLTRKMFVSLFLQSFYFCQISNIIPFEFGNPCSGNALVGCFLSPLFYLLHLSLKIPPFPYFRPAGYGFSLWDVWSVVYGVTMLLFLVLRTIRIARERTQAAAELEAARTVQQVLIPEEIPSIPGFVLHSTYKPAGQVGGDFFQFLPVKRGGVLVVIGDVSGKGLPAAMTVSLLVGTLRTLAHYTQSPGEILAAINQRMLARSHGGFTTCLVLRADADGTLTIANAGHIAPYVAGKELQLENGLPLGLAAESAYAESTFQIAPGEQLTLLTDGVPEARDKAGALFGFERSAALSTQSAEAIASAAQAFGQDDDITALTLSYAGVPAIA